MPWKSCSTPRSTSRSRPGPSGCPRRLLFKTLAVTPLVFVAPRVACEAAELTRGAPIPWERVPMILAEQSLSRRRVEAWFRARGARPTIYAEVAGHEAILPMVHLGCGVGVVPRLVMEMSLLKDEVRVLDVEPPLEAYDVGLAVHRRRLAAPIVRAVWEAADELARRRRALAPAGRAAAGRGAGRPGTPASRRASPQGRPAPPLCERAPVRYLRQHD